MSVIMPGRCRHCRCMESDACVLADGEPCCWIDSTRIVCSNPACIIAEKARRARAAALDAKPKSAFANWGYGAIVEELQRQSRSARRQRQRRKTGRVA